MHSGYVGMSDVHISKVVLSTPLGEHFANMKKNYKFCKKKYIYIYMELRKCTGYLGMSDKPITVEKREEMCISAR